MTSVDITLLLHKAEEYLANADVDRAAELYRQAHAFDARSPLPSLGLARVALALRRSDDAQHILDPLLAQEPVAPLALTLRGVVEEQRGNPTGALQWHERAVGADPASSLGHFNRGRVLGQLERWPEAAQALEKAVESGGAQHCFLYALGTALFFAGDVEGAIRALSSALIREPGQLDTYLSLADALTAGGRLDLADQLLANALERFPSAAAAHSKRIALALRRQDFDSARRLADQHAKVELGTEQTWLTSAVLHSSVLDLNAAEQAAHRALQVNPKSWRAHYQLGVIAETRGHRGAAKTAYQRACALGPREWRPLNNLATLLMEEGAFPTAKRALEKALATAPDHERFLCRYNLALAHWRLGDLDASRLAAEEAVRGGPPGHTVVLAARRFLLGCSTQS